MYIMIYNVTNGSTNATYDAIQHILTYTGGALGVLSIILNTLVITVCNVLILGL